MIDIRVGLDTTGTTVASRSNAACQIDFEPHEGCAWNTTQRHQEDFPLGTRMSLVTNEKTQVLDAKVEVED